MHFLAAVRDSGGLPRDVIHGDDVIVRGVPRDAGGSVEVVLLARCRSVVLCRGGVEAVYRLAVGHGEDEDHEDESRQAGDQHRFTHLEPTLTVIPTRNTHKRRAHYSQIPLCQLVRSSFEAGRRQVRNQIPLRYLVRTSIEPGLNQLRTS